MQNFFAEYIILMYHYIPVGHQNECNINREGLLTLGRAGPRDVVAGGALKAEVLNRAAKAARRVGLHRHLKFSLNALNMRLL